MRGANFRGADLECADLSSSALRNADFRGFNPATGGQPTNLTGADLSSSGGCGTLLTNQFTIICGTTWCDGTVRNDACPGGTDRCCSDATCGPDQACVGNACVCDLDGCDLLGTCSSDSGERCALTKPAFPGPCACVGFTFCSTVPICTGTDPDECGPGAVCAQGCCLEPRCHRLCGTAEAARGGWRAARGADGNGAVCGLLAGECCEPLTCAVSAVGVVSSCQLACKTDDQCRQRYPSFQTQCAPDALACPFIEGGRCCTRQVCVTDAQCERPFTCQGGLCQRPPRGQGNPRAKKAPRR
jgi:hypothetical protein